MTKSKTHVFIFKNGTEQKQKNWIIMNFGTIPTFLWWCTFSHRELRAHFTIKGAFTNYVLKKKAGGGGGQ